MKYWREIFIVILIIVVLFSVQKCKQNNRDIGLINNTASILKDSLTEYKLKAVGLENTLVTQARTHIVETGQLKDFVKQAGIHEKQLTNQIGKLNNMVGYYQVKANVRDTFRVTDIDTVYNDNGTTVEAKYFDWHNDHLHVQGIHTGKSTIIDYKYNFGFELIPYWKRKGILGLGKSQLVTDIRFDDPNARVQEMKAVVITPPKKRWYETKGAALGVGLLAGFFLAK